MFGIPDAWGAYHMSELPFVFAPFSNCSQTAEDTALSTAWGAMLDGLLTSSEPGCAPSSTSGGCVPWPAFDATGQTMLLGNWYDHSRPLSSVVGDGALLSADMVGDGERKLASTCPYVDSIYWLPDAHGRYWASNAAIPQAALVDARGQFWRRQDALLAVVACMIGASFWLSRTRRRERGQGARLL